MDPLRRDFLNSIRTPRNKLPRYLWRAQHADSQTSWTPTSDLVAGIPDHLPSSHYEFRASLTRHLKWGFSRAQSHFISTFDSYHLAVEWARAKGEEGAIYRVETKKIGDACLVFNVARLVRKLGIGEILQNRALEDLEHEFVVLSMVPYRALDFIESVGIVIEEREEYPMQQRRRALSSRSTCSSVGCVSLNLKSLMAEHLIRVREEKQKQFIEVEERDVSDVGEDERVDSVLGLRK